MSEGKIRPLIAAAAKEMVTRDELHASLAALAGRIAADVVTLRNGHRDLVNKHNELVVRLAKLSERVDKLEERVVMALGRGNQLLPTKSSQ